MDDFYVYCYRDPLSNFEPIYVGKGKGLRAYDHLSSKIDTLGCNKHFIRRLQKMNSMGAAPFIEFLIKDIDEELAFFVESEAIRKFGRRDLKTGSLTNMSNGGEGPSGAVRSAETRKKISESNKGRKHTPEAKAKISAASKRPMSEAQKKKMSELKIGKKFSDEAKKNMSKSKMGIPHRHDVVICPHCGKSGNKPALVRWHFGNCTLSKYPDKA